MPRAARQISDIHAYHIMSRSISELNLFRSDDDKKYYLLLVKRYIEKYHCKILAYCLMDTHVHLFINTCGFSISTFMLSLNTAYVLYYNRRYKRHGHLFQGRFTSFIVDNDKYSLSLSAYIHNNPKNLPGYDGKEELYRYSSYGIYLGIRKDYEGIVDTDFILKFFTKDKNLAQAKYLSFVKALKDTSVLKEIDSNIMQAYSQNIYKSGKSFFTRYMDAEQLLQAIEILLGEHMTKSIRAKFSRECSKVRALVVYTMRVLCGYTYQKICDYIGNMSISGISRLSTEGFKLLKDRQYRLVFDSLLLKSP